MDGNEKKKARTYTAEFRASAVKLAVESSQPMSQTARDLGVSKDTLYSWVSAARDRATASQETSVGSVHEELQRLRREVVVLREERDILKKAAAYFARSVT